MGENNMMVVVNNRTADKHVQLCEMKDAAYCGLITLAELDDTELVECYDDNMCLALERILRYGSCSDTAHAISYYIDYKFATHSLDIA